MVADAIARQYDVDKNSVKLDINEGTITFHAKKKSSIDLDKIHASIKVTRLSGRTGMEVQSLQITVRGTLRGLTPDRKAPENVRGRPTLLLEIPATGQEFILVDEKPSSGSSPIRDLEARRTPTQVTVTGFVDGWKSPFPPFLNTPPPPGKAGMPPLLLVSKVSSDGDR